MTTWWRRGDETRRHLARDPPPPHLTPLPTESKPLPAAYWYANELANQVSYEAKDAVRSLMTHEAMKRPTAAEALAATSRPLHKHFDEVAASPPLHDHSATLAISVMAWRSGGDKAAIAW